MPDHLIAPHGGTLVDLFVDDERASSLKAESRDWPSHDLTPRQLCDLELLLSGGFSPLTGFMTRADHERVCAEMRLADGAGTLWPIPITLDVSEDLAGQLAPGSSLALRDEEGVMIAVLAVEDVWSPDREAEAEAVFGTANPEHPGVAHLLERDPALLRRRAGDGHRTGHALRLPPPAAPAGRAQGGVQQAGMDEGRRLPDPQPDAPRPPGADPARGQGGGGEPADPSRRRDDEAGRRRSLHARALLPGAAPPLPAQDGDALAAAARDAHGRPAGGGLARHHPQEPRLHAPHRRPRPRGGRAATRAARRSTGPTTRRSCCGSTRRSSAWRWCPSR